MTNLQSKLDAQGQQQQVLARNIAQVEDANTQLGERLEGSQHGLQQLETDIATQTQSLKQEIGHLQQEQKKLVGGLSKAFAQLVQDL